MRKTLSLILGLGNDISISLPDPVTIDIAPGPILVAGFFSYIALGVLGLDYPVGSDIVRVKRNAVSRVCTTTMTV
jgi:hypothetical protein